MGNGYVQVLNTIVHTESTSAHIEQTRVDFKSIQ